MRTYRDFILPSLAMGLVATACMTAAHAASGQPSPSPSAPRTTPAGQVELARLIDLCAQRLKLNIDYDAAALKGTVTLRLDAPLSDDDLWLLTNRVLAARGFTTVRVHGNAAYSVVKLAEAPGLAAAGSGMAGGTPRTATGAAAPADPNAVAAATEPAAGYRAVVVRSQHRSGKDLVEPLSKVLTKPGGSVSVVGDGSLLLITDLADRVDRALELLAQLDQAAASVSIVEVPLTNLSGAQMAALLGQVAAKREAAGGGRLAGELMAAPEPGSVLVVAPESQLGAWRELIASLDKRERPETVTYVPRVFSPKDVAKLIEQTVKTGPGGAGAGSGPFSAGGGPGSTGTGSGAGLGGEDRWKLVIDELTSSLVITATPAQHEAIRALIERLDSVPAAARRPVRTFVIKNRPVQEVLGVLERLLQAGVLEAAGGEGAAGQPAQYGSSATGASQPGGGPNDSGSTTAALSAGSAANSRANINGDPSGAARTTPMPPPPRSSGAGNAVSPLLPGGGPTDIVRGGGSHSSGPGYGGNSATGGGDRPIVLTTDEGTNTLIAVGEPRLLDRVEALLKTIDVRQPQVMLEVLLVTVSESQALDLGMELEKIRINPSLSLRLSSLFGLGVRGAGGDRNAGDASGGTGVILSPGDFSIVFRLLQTIADGRALSMPKLLVGNNQSATLNSVVQQPYASVNASNTVSTTSFGGTQDAGTVVTIKPQIAEGEHLLLTYSVSLSSFVGAASSPTLPPARQQNSVQSVATIPDGYTVVVGGIDVENQGKTTSQVPFLGDIPIIGEAFKSRSNTSSRSRFFVFIRANVLRGAGRGFEDLKYLSDREVVKAGIDDGWPELKPRVIR